MRLGKVADIVTTRVLVPHYKPQRRASAEISRAVTSVQVTAAVVVVLLKRHRSAAGSSYSLCTPFRNRHTAFYAGRTIDALRSNFIAEIATTGQTGLDHARAIPAMYESKSALSVDNGPNFNRAVLIGEGSSIHGVPAEGYTTGACSNGVALCRMLFI